MNPEMPTPNLKLAKEQERMERGEVVEAGLFWSFAAVPKQSQG